MRLKFPRSFRLLIPAVALTCQLGAAQVNSAYNSATINNTDFSLKCQWVAKDAFPVTRSGYITDFFVADGIVFVNDITGEENRFFMERFDAESGEYLGKTTLVWDVEGTPTGTTFIGTDSEGKPFVASKAAHNLQSDGYPFIICPIDIIDGVPHAVDRYLLPLYSPWWPRDPFINGTFSSGKFEVIAPIWQGENPTKEDRGQKPQTGAVVKWVVDGSKTATPVAEATCTISECITMPLGDGNILIYDRNRFGQTTGFDYNKPHICRFNDTDNGLITIDVFAGEVDDNSYGFATAKIGDVTFAFYSDRLVPCSYKVMSLPQFPASFANYNHVWTIEEQHMTEQSPATSYIDRKKGTVIHAVQGADKNAADFYVLSDGKGLARYNLSTGNTQVGDVAVSVEHTQQKRYITLSGITVTNPVAGNIYICLTSDGKAGLVKF